MHASAQTGRCGAAGILSHRAPSRVAAHLSLRYIDGPVCPYAEAGGAHGRGVNMDVMALLGARGSLVKHPLPVSESLGLMRPNCSASPLMFSFVSFHAVLSPRRITRVPSRASACPYLLCLSCLPMLSIGRSKFIDEFLLAGRQAAHDLYQHVSQCAALVCVGQESCERNF